MIIYPEVYESADYYDCLAKDKVEQKTASEIKVDVHEGSFEL